MPLSEAEIERYRRQLRIENWNQEKLANARVLIVGAGGLGGASATCLALAGVGYLRLCDSDKVELSNLNRQILYSSRDIGRPKVQLAAEELLSCNPEIMIDPISDKLTEDNARELLSGCDLIIDGLDNHDDRMLLNKASCDLRIPYIYGAVDEWQGQLSFFNPPGTACLACLLPGPIHSLQPTSVFGAVPIAIGSLQATLALRYLMTGETPLANVLLIFHADTMNFETVAFEKLPNCTVCAANTR